MAASSGGSDLGGGLVGPVAGCNLNQSGGDQGRVPHGRYGPGERLRRNIAADFEINDDIYGDGLPVPNGAALPSLLRLEDGLLMEEYLRTASMTGLTADLAWLDCGSGADG